METLIEICERRYFKWNLRIRCEHTKQQYRYAIKNLSTLVGHEATKNDLSDDCLAGMMRMLLDKGLDPHTVNGRRERIKALWEWLARRQEVSVWPTVQNVPEPIRIPRAWTLAELRSIYDAARATKGKVGTVPSPIWWTACLWTSWNTGERIGAMMATRWEHIHRNLLTVPFEVRKGRRKEACYELWPETLEALRLVRLDSRSDLLLPWPYHESTLWNRYGAILKAAGLPNNRYTKFQKIRRTFATQIHLNGGNPTDALLHESSATARRYYVDRTQEENKVQGLITKFGEMTPNS